MSTYHVIDKESWHRRDHFEFYRTFANPSFNLCVPVEAQRLYECAKDRQVSFFQLALYALLRQPTRYLSSSSGCEATILLNMMILR